MGFLQAVQLLGALVPIVKDAVLVAEELFGGGRGTEKAKHAADLVMAAMPKAEEHARTLELVGQVVGPLVESVVSAANASGTFKKGGRGAKPRVKPRAIAPAAPVVDQAAELAARLAAARDRAEAFGRAGVPLHALEPRELVTAADLVPYQDGAA